MMPKQQYNHKALIEELDLFFNNNDSYIYVWEYTKRMIQAHNPSDQEEAWYEFDQTLTGENVSIPLQGIIFNLLQEIPNENTTIGLHRALTIGRARARGLSRQEALEAHLQALDDLTVTSQPPNLQVIYGGKN